VRGAVALRAVLAAALLALALPTALPPAVPGATTAAQAASPFGADDADDADDAPADVPAGLSPRLRQAVETLREGPLYVEPELGWTLEGDTRRRLEKDLRGARVPVVVAVLPSVDEDESGGDTERVLQTLQRELRKDAVYVTVDQDGRMDLASMGVPLDLRIPYSLLTPERLGRVYSDSPDVQPVPGYLSVPGRLREMLGHIAVAEAGSPNAMIDEVDPIDPLFRGETEGVTGDVVAASITGLLLGLVAAGAVLLARRLYIAATPVAAQAPTRGRVGTGGAAARGPVGAQERGGRAKGRRRRRRGRGGKRRGRRDA
jgi:hypothetical protein